jgi:hypothetical protein
MRGEGFNMAEPDENLLAEPTKELAEVTAIRRASAGGSKKPPVIQSGKETAIGTGDDFVTTTCAASIVETRAASIPETEENSAIESRIDPVAGIVEAALTEDLEVLEELGDEGVRTAESVANSYFGGFRILAAETADYAKECMESRVAFTGALLGAKSFESVVELQTSYAKSAHARLLAHLMKMSGLSWSLLGEAFQANQVKANLAA